MPNLTVTPGPPPKIHGTRDILTYRDQGSDYFTRLDPDKQTRRLVAQLERLGHIVTLQEAAA